MGNLANYSPLLNTSNMAITLFAHHEYNIYLRVLAWNAINKIYDQIDSSGKKYDIFIFIKGF